MEKPLCSRCKQLTWPDRWCECDPRDQMADFLREECVILMPDEIYDEQAEAVRAPTPAAPPPDELAPRRRRRRARHAH